MDTVVQAFLSFIKEELEYLDGVEKLLKTVPSLISTGRFDNVNFVNFLEKYEMETYVIAGKKKSQLLALSEFFNMNPAEISFGFLVSRGYTEFVTLQQELLRLSNQISLTMLKVSIYLNRYAGLNDSMKRLNRFLFNSNYDQNGTQQREQMSSRISREA